MDRKLTWLHLSDLHLCKAKTGWDAGRVLETLVTDLSHMQQTYNLHPDFIFFTGDSVFGTVGHQKGETIQEQFSELPDFFDGIRNAFCPALDKENLFIVPGNHDVERSEATPALTEWLDSQSELDVIVKMISSADRQWQHYMERLTQFRKFLEDNGYTHLLEDPQRLVFKTIREVNSLKVGITGLNSAWSCCRNREKGKLWMGGQWQVGSLRIPRKDVDISIALIHHPPNWLVEQEDPNLWRSFDREFNFVLHGHEHQGWVDKKTDSCTRIAAAACYDRSDSDKNGYNFVNLDLNTGKGEVWLRKYDADGGSWGPRFVGGDPPKTNNDGVWPLNDLSCLKNLTASLGFVAPQQLLEEISKKK